MMDGGSVGDLVDAAPDAAGPRGDPCGGDAGGGGASCAGWAGTVEENVWRSRDDGVGDDVERMWG